MKVESLSLQQALLLPPGQGSFEALLEVGQEVSLYGGITVKNDGTSSLSLKLEFRLRGGGFYLSGYDKDTGAILFGQTVKAPQVYLVSELSHQMQNLHLTSVLSQKLQELCTT